MSERWMTLYIPSAVSGGVAFFVTLVVTPLFIRLGLKLGIVDLPGGRKIHDKPIPYLGGVGFFCGLLGSMLAIGLIFPDLWRLEYWGIFLGSLVICLLGSFDDIRGLGAWSKLPFEILIILVVYHFGLRVDRLTNPLGESLILGWMGLPVTILWYLGIMNAINLSDGLDGLAAGIACIASLTMFIIGAGNEDIAVCITAAAVFGLTFAFLRYNFHPAKIFMGDTGSLLLGFLLASIGILSGRKGSTALPLLVPIIALGVSILDTLMAIGRRLYRGVHVFKADREHLHHRLLALGLTQRQAVLLIYYFCAYLSVASLVLSELGTRHTILVLIVLAMGLFFIMLALEFIEKKTLDQACRERKEKESGDEKN